jgi:outer membrane protein assembly factor BamB
MNPLTGAVIPEKACAVDEPRNRAWFTEGGGNARRGLFRGRVEIAAKPVRTLTAQASVQTSVVFDPNGRAFIADMSGGVQAFTPEGRRLWHKQLEGGISATPVVDPIGKMLFAGTHAGRAFALDANNGAVAWRTEIPTESDARILSDLLYLPRGRVIVLSSWGGRYLYLDAESGKERHSWDAGISPASGAAADDEDNVYCLRAVRQSGVQLVRIDADGKESVLYSQAEKGRPSNRLLVSAAPVLDRERRVLYFIANDTHEGNLHAWSLESNRIAWSREFSAAVRATPAVAEDGTVVIADLRGDLHALAPGGSRLYRYASGADFFLAGGVCDLSGTVFVGDPLGMVHEIPLNGSGRQMFEIPRSVQARPSFDAAGNLYIAATDRKVYVFRNSRRIS